MTISHFLKSSEIKFGVNTIPSSKNKLYWCFKIPNSHLLNHLGVNEKPLSKNRLYSCSKMPNSHFLKYLM